MASVEATNTVKQGKNAKRTNGTHFTRVQGGGFIGSAPNIYHLLTFPSLAEQVKGPSEILSANRAKQKVITNK